MAIDPADDELVWEQRPPASPFLKFTLWVVPGIVLVVALLGGAGAYFLARQHHLAQGYLFRTVAQLVYVHV
jgi:uncharacterized membrane protein (DUF441 family)